MRFITWESLIIITFGWISFELARLFNVEFWKVGIFLYTPLLIIFYRKESNIPEPYRFRDCTGREWKKRFPETSKHKIRLFLTCLVDGMIFEESDRLKFLPEDKLIDIYRSIYGGETPFSDEMECEFFLEDVAREFQINSDDLYSICQEETTLGEIFDFVISKSKNPLSTVS